VFAASSPRSRSRRMVDDPAVKEQEQRIVDLYRQQGLL
jgi:hypothetical protein